MKPSALVLFLRTFFVQGSFNYRTLIGGGFLWVLLPGLRDREDEATVFERHSEPFNSHPYLVGVAAGAVVKMESEGESPETIRRFKEAVRSSLGSLGDLFFWAALRPALLVFALVAWRLGVGHWLIVASFLIVYNVIHVGVRWWSVRVGLREGAAVGASLGKLDLGTWATRLMGVGSIGLGLLGGLLLIDPLRQGVTGLVTGVLIGGVFVLGLRRGAAVVRPTRVTLIAVVFILALMGFS